MMAENNSSRTQFNARSVGQSAGFTEPGSLEPGSLEPGSLERLQLWLIKGDHRWNFCWEAGGEGAMIDRVAELARNPAIPFDWFDAAAVCTCIVQPAQSAATSGTSMNCASPPGSQNPAR